MRVTYFLISISITILILLSYFIIPYFIPVAYEQYIDCNKLIDSKPIDIYTVHNSPFYEKTLTEVRHLLKDVNADSFQQVIDLMNETIQNPPFYENVYEINRETGNQAVIYREGMPFGFHITHSPVIVHGILLSDNIHSLINSNPIQERFWSKNNLFFV